MLERDFHRKISTGYLPYFRGVERGAERTVKSFYTHPINGLKVKTSNIGDLFKVAHLY